MDSLENQLLIAMPSLDDSYFNKTVTYICEHNSDGAMGLIINLPVNISLHDLLQQLEDFPANETTTQQADSKSAHKAEHQSENKTKQKPEQLESTANTEAKTENPQLAQRVLSGGPIAQQRGFVLHSPQSGWNSSLTLSSEVMITTSKDILLALDTPVEMRWKKATEKLGIDIAHLSTDVGHA